MLNIATRGLQSRSGSISIATRGIETPAIEIRPIDSVLPITKLANNTIVYLKLFNNKDVSIKVHNDSGNTYIDPSIYKRIVPMKFVAHVVNNNASARTISVFLSKRDGSGYIITLKYNQIQRISRLINNVLDLTEAEEKVRRKSYSIKYDSERLYFHPMSKFVPVRILGL